MKKIAIAKNSNNRRKLRESFLFLFLDIMFIHYLSICNSIIIFIYFTFVVLNIFFIWLYFGRLQMESKDRSKYWM